MQTLTTAQQPAGTILTITILIAALVAASASCQPAKQGALTKAAAENRNAIAEAQALFDQ